MLPLCYNNSSVAFLCIAFPWITYYVFIGSASQSQIKYGQLDQKIITNKNNIYSYPLWTSIQLNYHGLNQFFCSIPKTTHEIEIGA